MSDKEQDLWHAALDGDLDRVKGLIEEGANINAATDLFRATALHRAVLLGNSKAVTTLIDAGIDIHMEDTDGFTALHMATRSGDRESLRRLIKTGADIESKNRDGRTPLHIAALNGDYKTTEVLVNEGAKPIAIDKHLKTPSDLARKGIERKRSEGALEQTEGFYRTIHFLEDKINEQKGSGRYQQFQESESESEDCPDPIRRLGPDAERKFLDFLAEGSESHFEINVMFVGHSEAGKTTLTRGLLGELNPSIPPDRTNGIDLHQYRCKYNRKTRQMYGTPKESSSENNVSVRAGNLYRKLSDAESVKVSKKLEVDMKKVDENLRGHFGKSVQSSTGAEMDVRTGNGNLRRHTKKRSRSASDIQIDISTGNENNESTTKMVAESVKYSEIDMCTEERNHGSAGRKRARNSIDIEVELCTGGENLKHVPKSIAKCAKNEEVDMGTLDNNQRSLTEHGKMEDMPISIQMPATSASYAEMEKTNDNWRPSRLLHKANLGSSNSNLVPITLWDFGGQSIFYTTHQTFLSSRCIYIMTFDISIFQHAKTAEHGHLQDAEHEKRNILENIAFWTNSIITYAKDKVPGFPKIILVGTHVDKIPIEDKDLEVWRIFQELEEYFRGKNSRQHLIIDPRYFLNATDTEGVSFELVRDIIIQIAESQPHWGEKMPTKWLLLEDHIADQKSNGVKMMTIQEIEKFTQTTKQVQMEKEELCLFLQFRHSLGNILYFNEPSLHDYVILDPRWLIDALCTLITSEDFATKNIPDEYIDLWTEMESEGKLYSVLIKEIWSQPKYKELFQNMDVLLQMMDRLDLITRPSVYKQQIDENEEFYYVPSMVKKMAPGSVKTEVIFSSSSDLTYMSFTFRERFLPPAVFYRLVADMLSMFDVVESCEYAALRTFPHKSPLLFSDLCVFRMEKYKRLVIQRSEHRILVHLYRSDNRGKKPIDHTSFKYMQSLINDSLKNIVRLYSSFQANESSGKDGDLPFYLEIPCCRRDPPCMITRRMFRNLREWKCPGHSLQIMCVSTLKEMFNKQVDTAADIRKRSEASKKTERVAHEKSGSTELKLDYVASKVSETIYLAANLNIKYDFLQKIRHVHDAHEKTFSTLYHWYNTMCNGDSLTELHSALGEIERNDVREKLSTFSRAKYFLSEHLHAIPNQDAKILPKDIGTIAKKTTNYKRLARFLGIPQINIEKVEHRDVDMSEKAIEVLSQWERHDSQNTRRTLCAGLVYLKEKRLINELISNWKTIQ